MSPWLNKITLEGFRDAESGDWPRFARQLADKLPGLLKADGELTRIAKTFEGLDPAESCVDDFDDALRRLYDWGDYGKRLWVEVL